MKRFRTALLLIVLAAGPASAQQANHGHMAGTDHDAMMAMDRAAGMPLETGQSAFAAIQEITGILASDPSTDWNKVDIEALRQHLIDMNHVTLGASVAATEESGRIRFAVSGSGHVQDSIRRMVLAHAATMNGQNGWGFKAESTSDGAVLTVTPPDPTQLPKLRALGFIGVMTQGMHHQTHHLMIAKGHSPH